MEKLILRSVMYGADKIPDSWFEKVPGGFYKSKDGSSKKSGGGGSNPSSRPSTSDSGGRDRGASDRNRRHSAGDATRGPPPEEDMEDSGYRSSGGGRSRRRDRERQQRDSYDGHEDDDLYSGDDRRRRRNHSSHRRRRSYDEDNRNADGYGYGMPSRDDRYDERRMNPPPPAPYPEGDFGPDPRRPSTHFAPPIGGAAAVGAPAGAAATGAAPYPHSNLASPLPQSPQPAGNTRSGVSTGYIPYANIYGTSAQPQQPFSPPPQSSSGRGSVQPNDSNRVAHPVAPPPGHYQQDPYAQDHATAAAAGAGAAYGGQAGYTPAYDPGYDQRYGPSHDTRYDRRYDDRYNGYDEAGRPYSLSPPRHDTDRRRHEHSPDRDSYDDDRREDDRRKSRASHRPDDPRRTKSQGGRGKSSIRERFDTSQRGLGYGAVGAVAGGLIGSEFGHGPLPKMLGAAVGALGANAYEARERRKDGQREQAFNENAHGRREHRQRDRDRDGGYHSD